MHIEPFVMERWQSTFEHHVDLNLSDSGVHPLTVRELLDPDEHEAMLEQQATLRDMALKNTFIEGGTAIFDDMVSDKATPLGMDTAVLKKVDPEVQTGKIEHMWNAMIQQGAADESKPVKNNEKAEQEKGK